MHIEILKSLCGFTHTTAVAKIYVILPKKYSSESLMLPFVVDAEAEERSYLNPSLLNEVMH